MSERPKHAKQEQASKGLLKHALFAVGGFISMVFATTLGNIISEVILKLFP